MLLPLTPITHATGQSNALQPTPRDPEAPANYRIISSVDDSIRNSFYKSSAKIISFHSSPNLDFNPDNNDSTDVEFHLQGTSESRFDADRRLNDPGRNHRALDSSRSAVAIARNQSISSVTSDEYNMFDSDPQPIVASTDDNQSNRESTHNTDGIEEDSNWGDGLEEGRSNGKDRKTSSWKSSSRKAQGALLS